MLNKIRFILIAICVFSLCLVTFSQDEKEIDGKRVVGEVSVSAVDPIYKEIRSLSSDTQAFSGEYATVNNLLLIKDTAQFTLKTGEIYFLKSVEGKNVGGVFFGDGEISLTPPIESEKKHLQIFIDSPTLKENFNELVMFFTDTTLQAIKNSISAKMGSNGPQASKARDAFRSKENLLRKRFRYNVTSRILSDVYAPKRLGFFTAFINGDKYSKLIFQIDPMGIPQVYPEQVSLQSYDQETGGIWAAYHLQSEYIKGTANSWQDRRSYDITHQNIDTTVDGTKLKVKDEITIKMLEANSRLLSFDLFPNLRVNAVTDEAGSAITFIQEDKDEDGDFAIILSKPLEVGKSFKIIVEYEGDNALKEAGSGNYILIPRSTWYPNNPASAFGDRSTFDLTFRYPKNLTMVGIGQRVGEDVIEDGDKISKWTSGKTEMAVAGFNYGDFKMKDVKDEMSGYTLEVFVNKDLPDEIKGIQTQIELDESRGIRTGTTIGSLSTSGMANTVLTEAQNSMRLYNIYFGKLPYERIAMTQQPAGNFGQAWGTLIFMPYTAFIDSTQRVQLMGIDSGTNSFWREVSAHEVAHQWWGHIVGWTSYRDQWMSEGFSEFSTSLYIQYIKQDIDGFIKFWDGQRDQIVKATPRTRGKKPFTIGPVTQGYRLNSAKTGGAYQNLAYPKGAFILHMLRMMMYDRKSNTGDDAFKLMMQDFIKSNYNKDVSTEDFKKIVEKHMNPSMNLGKNGKMDWFFDQWVYGTEMPSYKFDYEIGKKDGRSILSGKITQSGVSDKFVMPVPLYADFGKGWVYIGSANMTGNSSVELNNVALPKKPKKVVIAALHDILAEDIDNNKK